MRIVRTALALLALAVFSAFPVLAGETVMMATTTSTQDSGLLDYIAPIFQKDTGVELKWVSVGTGKALEHGKNCDVDVLLVHAPKAEQDFVAAGHGVDRRLVMYNDFVIIGPAKDPAGVKGKSIPEALKTLAEKKIVFVSRGDDSGTHKKELSLWKAAGMATPDKESWYVQAGQGMIATIAIASERGGYTMTDRGTFIKYEAQNKGKPPLVILIEGDKTLINQYSVMMVNPEKCAKLKKAEAAKFLDWWVSPKAQKAVADFKLEGKQLFFPNAGK